MKLTDKQREQAIAFGRGLCARSLWESGVTPLYYSTHYAVDREAAGHHPFEDANRNALWLQYVRLGAQQWLCEALDQGVTL